SLIHKKKVIGIGDHVFVDGILFRIQEGLITMITPEDKLIQTALPPLYGSSNKFDVEYPNYHRSPRIIHREPEDKRVIAKPSNKPSKPSEQLMRTIIPPIVMIAA